jgi:hypothetical protein
MTWRVARFSPTPTTGWKGRPFLPNPNYEGAPFLAWFARSGALLVIRHKHHRTLIQTLG